MLITLDRNVAYNLFTQASKTCNLKSTGELSSEFIFFIKYNEIYLISFNEFIEQTIRVDPLCVDNTVDTAYFSVGGQCVLDFIRQFDHDKLLIKFDIQKNVVILASDNKKLKMAFPLTTLENFEPQKFNQGQVVYSTSANAFCGALKHTAFCCSTEILDSALFSSVRVINDNDTLSFLASDSVRIASFSYPNTCENTCEYFLAKPLCDTLINLFSTEGDITIYKSNYLLKIQTINSVLICNLQNVADTAIVQDLENWINKEHTSNFRVSKSEIVKTIKLSQMISKTAILDIKFEGKIVKFISKHDSSQMQNEIAVEQYDCLGSTRVYTKLIEKAVDLIDNSWIDGSLLNLSGDNMAIIFNNKNFKFLVFPLMSDGK